MRDRVRRRLNGSASAIVLCILLSAFATASSTAALPAKDKNPHPKSGFRHFVGRSENSLR